MCIRSGGKGVTKGYKGAGRAKAMHLKSGGGRKSGRGVGYDAELEKREKEGG